MECRLPHIRQNDRHPGALGSTSQTSGCPRIPRLTRAAFTIPVSPSNMNRQSSAETTVGIAQGTSTAARTRPRKRNARFKARASQRPMTSSRVTLATAKNAYGRARRESEDRRKPLDSCRVRRRDGRARASGGRAGGAIPRQVHTSGKSATITIGQHRGQNQPPGEAGLLRLDAPSRPSAAQRTLRRRALPDPVAVAFPSGPGTALRLGWSGGSARGAGKSGGFPRAGYTLG